MTGIRVLPAHHTALEECGDAVPHVRTPHRSLRSLVL